MGSLVTGIGYIGSRLAEMLLDSGEPVVGLDNLFSTDPAVLQRLQDRPGFTLVRGDVADEADVRRAFESGVTVDTVYHLAAQASAHPSAAPTRYTEETNLIGPRVVMERACAAGATTFVFGSSIQVYGRRVAGRVDESRPYGAILDISHLSKVYVEKLMEMYAHVRALRCVAARLGLVYGLGPVMKTDPRFMTAPNKFCLQAARGETLRVDAGGLHPTGLIHLEDAARGLIALARWPGRGFAPVNLVGETASVARVAELVRGLGARRGLDVRVAMPDERPEGEGCSFESASSRVGFLPRVSLERGLEGVLDHFLAHAAPSSREHPPPGAKPPGGSGPEKGIGGLRREENR